MNVFGKVASGKEKNIQTHDRQVKLVLYVIVAIVQSASLLLPLPYTLPLTH